MKHRLVRILSAFGFVLATSSFAHSQENEFAFSSKEISPDAPASYSTKSPEKLADVEVNVKAIKNLAKQFKQTGQVKWYKVSDGYIADFVQHGDRLRVGFDEDGNWVYKMVSYAEDKLPQDVRHLVKSTYYNYSITWVNEVKKNNQVTYIVHLKNDSSFKNVRVSDGEMQVTEELSITPVQK